MISPPPGQRLLNCIDKYLLNILLSLEYLLTILLSFVLYKLNILPAGFLLASAPSPTPLQRKLSRLSIWHWIPTAQKYLWPPNAYVGFLDGSDGKESACSAGDPGLIPGSGRAPGEGNGNPVQYSCLQNSMGRGDWWATIHGVTESWTQLSDLH